MQWKQYNALRFQLWAWGRLRGETAVGVQETLVPLATCFCSHQNNRNQKWNHFISVRFDIMACLTWISLKITLLPQGWWWRCHHIILTFTKHFMYARCRSKSLLLFRGDWILMELSFIQSLPVLLWFCFGLFLPIILQLILFPQNLQANTIHHCDNYLLTSTTWVLLINWWTGL